MTKAASSTRTTKKSIATTAEPLGKRAANARAIRRNILEAATRLFTKVGYEKTTIAQILTKSDISLGTFYKYFDSKQAILLAIVAEERLRSRATVEAAVLADTRNQTDYLLGIIMAALDPSDSADVPALWRELIAATIVLSADPAVAQSLTLDRNFYTGQVLSGLRVLIDRGQALPDLPAKSVSETLYCICAHEFQDFVCGRYATHAAFVSQIRTQTAAVIGPWLVRQRRRGA